MNNKEIAETFIKSSLKLGEEILEKDNQTPAEKQFLSDLDDLLEIMEKLQ